MRGLFRCMLGLIALLATPSLSQSQTAPALHVASRGSIVVAAAKNSWNLNLNEFQCISISRKIDLIFGVSYFDDELIKAAAARLLSDKTIENHDEKCSYVLLFNIMHHTTRAVKYFGKPSTLFMSFGICTRSSTGLISSKSCISKNIYLFRRDLAPLEAFEVGLKALLRAQDAEWELMRIDLSEGR